VRPRHPGRPEQQQERYEQPQQAGPDLALEQYDRRQPDVDERGDERADPPAGLGGADVQRMEAEQ